jgi:hypothetical protein
MMFKKEVVHDVKLDQLICPNPQLHASYMLRALRIMANQLIPFDIVSPLI